MKTIGSTSYLTDHDGNVSQFVCYTPYGETLVDEHLTGVDSTFFAIEASPRQNESTLSFALGSHSIFFTIEASPRQFANKFAIALGSHSIFHKGTFSISQMRKSKLACDLPATYPANEPTRTNKTHNPVYTEENP